MAPKTRARAAAAAERGTTRAKRGRAPSTAASAEEEANDSTRGAVDANQGSYETLQQELADLRREMAALRHPPGAALAVLSHPPTTNEAEAAPSTSAPPPRHQLPSAPPPAPAPLPPPAPLLRGDPSSPLSVGLEMARWPATFKMPEVVPFEGRTDPAEFLRVYETAVEAAGGDDTTKAKGITLALRGVALTWFFTIPPRSIYAWE